MERYVELAEIRQTVLEQVARAALRGTLLEEVDALPYVIIDRDQPVWRCCVYHERAIVAERIRLAMGLDRNARKIEREPERLSEGAKQAFDLKQPEDPLIVVLDSACDACPIDRFMVTDACRNCVAHPCQSECPKQAIVIANNRAHIDQDRCIECSKCAKACPFHAIVEVIRPCIKACGVGALQGRHDRKAKIDYRKCTSCGHCIRACPFGAIAEKSQIVQVITMLQKPAPVYAAIAPAFSGQFGRGISVDSLRTAFMKLGFADMVEVALGADLVTLKEAQEFVEQVPAEKAFVMSSCCPSFRNLVYERHPGIRDNLFDSPSPMVLTGHWIKGKDPQAQVVFIGPCVAKKVEASKGKAQKYIDAVLTFEEVLALFQAAEINVKELEGTVRDYPASRTGRIFARSGGVTEALISTIKRMDSQKPVDPVRVEGLVNCEKLLVDAENGRLTHNLVEGMACLGGCVGGPGTIIKEAVAAKMVNDFSQSSPYSNTIDNPVTRQWANEDALKD